ncbi:MAG TPA: hypothetical protein VE956_24780 [Nodularia sp. (in: cyanobacteria)]|nr:hypothetical protein [Nodularia sp. (in: cyanobacteria)]
MGLQISISDSIVQAIRLPEQRIEQELLQELAIANLAPGIISRKLAVSSSMPSTRGTT